MDEGPRPIRPGQVAGRILQNGFLYQSAGGSSGNGCAVDRAVRVGRSYF
jgi:hypothetical protein